MLRLETQLDTPLHIKVIDRLVTVRFPEPDLARLTITQAIPTPGGAPGQMIIVEAPPNIPVPIPTLQRTITVQRLGRRRAALLITTKETTCAAEPPSAATTTPPAANT
jgi:hypothetical protein